MGWTRTSDKGKQSKGHRFKECTSWDKKTREQWGGVAGHRNEGKSESTAWKSRKRSGHHARQARARPSSTPARDLQADDRFTEAVSAGWFGQGGRPKQGLSTAKWQQTRTHIRGLGLKNGAL